MKTLKDYEQEFDDKFCSNLNTFSDDVDFRKDLDITPKAIKQFYRLAFFELTEEMVGEDTEPQGGTYKRTITAGKNAAKAEIRERIKKMLD